MNDSLLKRVDSAETLHEAISAGVKIIEIVGSISDLQSVRLPAGTRLIGIDGESALSFKNGQPGVVLSADHEIRALRLVCDETQTALSLADDASDIQTLEISDITTVGRVHLEASNALSGTLKLNNIHVERADARMAAHRPAGFGVEVLLGAITVYNSSKDKRSKWTVEATNLSGGSKENPLRGSGVFVFGGWYIPVDADMSTAPAPNQKGGSVDLTILTTGEVHVDGGIPKGIGNLITGGVFVGSGVHAAAVVNDGATTTYGQNDMVLDNWGSIDIWTAKAPVTSRGPSGIGFVNFGDIDILRVEAPIETYGLGARGFNLYDGTLTQAEFTSISTYGDGAIGVQIARPFGSIVVRGDIRTSGGEGESLVRGKVIHLMAHAFSLKPGTEGKQISIAGNVVTENSNVKPWDFEVDPKVVGSIEVGGKPLHHPD